jgi:hypothetical protein
MHSEYSAVVGSYKIRTGSAYLFVCTLKQQVVIMVLKTLGPSILGTSFAVPVHEDIPSSFDIYSEQCQR